MKMWCLQLVMRRVHHGGYGFFEYLDSSACYYYSCFCFAAFDIDVSYLVPVNNTATSGTNPLEGTLRFSLTFNLDKWGNNTKLETVN